MTVTYRQALEIITHEAICLEAYLDSVDTWTWSVGITNASGHNVERYIGNPQTMEHCLRIFVWALEKYATNVAVAFGDTPLSEEQFAAALSFEFNTGGIKRATWVKNFMAGDRALAKKNFMQWRKPPEIIPRREKERDLFFDGKWTQNGWATVYPVVNQRPDFKNPERVNIEDDLRRALGEEPAPEPPAPEPPVEPPQPPVEPPKPNPAPEPPPEPPVDPEPPTVLTMDDIIATGIMVVVVGGVLGGLVWLVKQFQGVILF